LNSPQLSTDPKPPPSPALDTLEDSQLQKGTNISWQEEAKLIFGVIFSLKNMMSKLSVKPGYLSPLFYQKVLNFIMKSDDLINYKTAQYKLHLYSAASGLKFVLMTNPEAETETRELLVQLYQQIYVEYVVKNSLYRLNGSLMQHDLFKFRLNEFIKNRLSTTT